MIDPVKITDEEITAYLDGEFEYTPAAEIENAINNNPAFASRVESLSIDKKKFVNAYDGLIKETPTMPNLSYRRDRWPKVSFAKIAAVTCIVLLVGIGLKTYFVTQSHPSWITYVASYQSLYSKNTLAHINQNELEATQELKRVSASIGRDIKFDSLDIHEILDYKRAQILNFEGQALMQITYLSKSGAPIALCIMRSESAAQISETPKFKTLEGMRSAYWQQGGYQFFLIGGKNEALIKTLSIELKNRI